MTNGPAAAPSAPGSGAERGVDDLLGLLAYAELASYFRMTDDARLAPTLAAKAELAGLAVAEYANHSRLCQVLRERGADPESAMLPFVEPLDSWHERTTPQDWTESLVKIYVGDGIARDFYRKVAELTSTDSATRELVADVVADTGRAEFVGPQVRAAVERDASLGARLSLWARRLVGEALSQAQMVATQRKELAILLAESAANDTSNGTTTRSDLASVSRMFATLTDAHNARLEAMGLNG